MDLLKTRRYAPLFTLLLLALLTALVALVASPAQGHAAAGTAPVKVTTANILVTASGMTLYTFALDKPKKSVCYGACAKYWPPLLVPKGMTPPASMTGMAGTFGMITRTDGTHQLTYYGAPLYTFLFDKKPGQMAGQGSTGDGGYWWAVVAPPAK